MARRRRKNPEDPGEIASALNQTARLGVRSTQARSVQAALQGLERGFHVNTVTGRLFHHWAVSLKGKVYAKVPTEEYWRLYGLWRERVAAACYALPPLRRVSVHTGTAVDVLRPIKNALDDPHLRGSAAALMKQAIAIEKAALGPLSFSSLRDYGNWTELAHEEFGAPGADDLMLDLYRQAEEVYRGRRGNPFGFLPALGLHAKAVRRAREADEAERALRDARRLPISRGMIRGSFVEISCPQCHARGLVERGAPLDLAHRGACTGMPYVVEVHARRPKGTA